MQFLRTSSLLFLAQAVVLAQDPPPAGAKDAIRNGGFERTLKEPNLWSGVDKDGFLTGFRGFLPVLNESGSIAESPMPVAVAVGDLNGDGLSDIVSSDPLGYVRIYFNSGSKEQPKFTSGELSLPWLASGEGEPPWRPPGPPIWGEDEIRSWNQRWARRRLGVRSSLADVSQNGKLDLVAGNYFGEIFLIPNGGSDQVPLFAQPEPLTKAIVPTTKDPTHRWGNVFSALLHDWDKDGKPDLLVGEGSYSANSIHLFLNQGSADRPTFNEEKRMALALGEGRQQLTPALADVNGDSELDILVTDRSARVTAYQRPKGWKFGESISPSGFLAKSGGLNPNPDQALMLGEGIHTLSAGDLNGDGMFDLIIGRKNGRIAWAANTGTKEAPKFDQPSDFSGEKPVPAEWALPSQWDANTGKLRGNFLAYANCVSTQEDPTAQPVEGTRALKFGYAAAPNKVVTVARPFLPAMPDFDRRGERNYGDALFRASADERGNGAPSNFFVLRQPLQMEIGKTYTLSLKLRGNKVSNGICTIGWRGFKKLAEDRLIRGERGAVQKQKNEIADGDLQSIDLRPSENWSTVTKEFKIQFKREKDLNKEKLTSEGIIEISFELTAPDGFLYLDDIKLLPEA